MMARKLRYQHILIATDVSASSASLLKIVIWLTRQSHCNLKFASALPDLNRAAHVASRKSQMNVDLIAIQTAGLNSMELLLLRNTFKKVLDHCDCGVLTVKPDGFVSPIPPLA